MPIITIVIFEGRTEELKGKLVKAITDDVVEIFGATGATREGTVIIYQEIPRTNYARGGTLASEKHK